MAVPGYAGFRNPAQASSLLQIIAGVNMATHCYKHSVLFGCAALLPNCSDNGRGVIRKTPPCRSLCESKLCPKTREILMRALGRGPCVDPERRQGIWNPHSEKSKNYRVS